MKDKVVEILGAKENVVFAYIFGSFVTEECFQDIDVGIYAPEAPGTSPLTLELKLEAELEAALRMPVDVRVINGAPLTFVYNVIKSGEVVVDRDATKRDDYEGLICKEYFDFQYLRKEYLREIVHAPV